MGKASRKRKGGVLSEADQKLWDEVSTRFQPLARKMSTADVPHKGDEDLEAEFLKTLTHEGSGRGADVAGAKGAPTVRRGTKTENAASAKVSSGGPVSMPEASGAGARPNPSGKARLRPSVASKSGAVDGELPKLEHKASRRLAKGSEPIEARLDLHGLTQAAAHAALRRFLFRCVAQQKRTALVITGKGISLDAEDAGTEPWGFGAARERGVLRRNLPMWLSDPDLRPLISGFGEASARHGGSGAFYIRLRRN